MEARDKLKAIVFEYVLSNGDLPGFQERLESTLKYWSVATEPFDVFRGQGHSKPGIQRIGNSPSQLRSDLRKTISTSRDIGNIMQFTNTKNNKETVCCVFKIQVMPGIRFLDLFEAGSGFIPDEIVEDFIKRLKEENEIRKIAKKNGKGGKEPLRLPPSKIPLLKIFKERLEKEKEVLLYSAGGHFSIKVEKVASAANGRTLRFFEVDFCLKKGSASKAPNATTAAPNGTTRAANGRNNISKKRVASKPPNDTTRATKKRRINHSN